MKNLAKLFILIAITGYLSATNAQEKKEIDKTFSLNKTGVLEIDNYKGSINITTWDKAEVKVHVLIESDGWGRDEEEKVANTEIIFRDSATRLSIETDYNQNRLGDLFGNSGNNPFVHYTITMPKTAKLDINDYKSDTEVTGLNSEVVFETYKGSVVFKDFVGSIDLETYKGDVQLYINKLTRDSKFETYKGRIDLYLPADTKFTVDADLGKKGDFDSDFEIDSDSRRRSRDEDYVRGDVNGGGPYVEFSTYKGDLRLLKK